MKESEHVKVDFFVFKIKKTCDVDKIIFFRMAQIFNVGFLNREESM